MKNKILLAIADGLGDRPCKDLNYLTPLQYAKTEILDSLAKKGCTGIVDILRACTPVGTDMGHLILFGYNFEDYPGRGPIEAFGEGIELLEGDIAFRCNFATIDENRLIKDRRAGRIKARTAELAESLNGLEIDDVKVIFKQATEHRAVLIFRGKNLSNKISDTDPKAEDKPIKSAMAKDDSPEAQHTAEILNKFILKAQEVLADHPVNKERLTNGLLPANCIITRGAGKMTKVETITERLKFKAACIAAESTVLGVAKLAGFKTLTHPPMTGNIDTDINLKAEYTIDALKENDLVCVHFKATDLMGHDNNPQGKVQAIEKYDKMLGLILNKLDTIEENVVVALAADHSTPCERKEHSGDPVPVLICGKNIRQDNVEKYDEISCSQGGLNRIKGTEFIYSMLDYLEVSKKEGN